MRTVPFRQRCQGCRRRCASLTRPPRAWSAGRDSVVPPRCTHRTGRRSRRSRWRSAAACDQGPRSASTLGGRADLGAGDGGPIRGWRNHAETGGQPWSADTGGRWPPTLGVRHHGFPFTSRIPGPRWDDERSPEEGAGSGRGRGDGSALRSRDDGRGSEDRPAHGHARTGADRRRTDADARDAPARLGYLVEWSCGEPMRRIVGPVAAPVDVEVGMLMAGVPISGR